MIIKRIDSKQKEIAELAMFLKSKLTPYQRFLIERELKATRSGAHGDVGDTENEPKKDIGRSQFLEV